MNERILLADGSSAFRGDLGHYFSGSHYTVEYASTGREAYWGAMQFQPDLMILDTDLFRGENADLFLKIRAKSQAPIILTSRNASVTERISGLNAGADDVLSKGCDMRELGARAKAVMRRSRAALEREQKTVTYDRFELSLEKYELKLGGKRVELTPKELQLLYFLASNPNKVFTRDQLLDQVWGYQYLGNTRTVDAHVRKVREKCDGVSDRWGIRTVWGVGYKFELA